MTVCRQAVLEIDYLHASSFSNPQ